jgi:hypothetical protein
MTRQILALAVGILCGLVIVAAVFFYNPFIEKQGLSPIAVTDKEVVHLSYSVAATDALVYTNDGESQVSPNPPRVPQLWEPTVRHTTATVNVLNDSRGRPAGIGVKFSSKSEDSSILDGKALVNSVWHIYLPERGSLFMQQTENYWSYIQDIVFPAYRSAGDNWRGNWIGMLTAGPGPLGLAWVAGGSGDFADIDTSAVEVLSAKAYTVKQGPVAMTGELSIELPTMAVSVTEQPQ